MKRNRSLVFVPAAILPYILLFLLSHPQVYAADTLKITITYRYRVDSSPGTPQRMVVSQKFHTSDDTLFREIRYDGETGQLSGYTFYFYKDGRRFSDETYGAGDEIISLLKHEYNSNGSIERSVQTGKDIDAAYPERETVYSYNRNGKLFRSQVLIFGKTAAKVKCTFDNYGKLARFTGKYKAAYDTAVKKEVRELRYDPSGSISEIYVTGKDAGGKSYSRIITYDYAGPAQPTAITAADGEGGILWRKAYTYLASGPPGTYEETDADGHVLARIEYAYRVNFMEKGVQRSVLDPAIGF